MEQPNNRPVKVGFWKEVIVTGIELAGFRVNFFSLGGWVGSMVGSDSPKYIG